MWWQIAKVFNSDFWRLFIYITVKMLMAWAIRMRFEPFGWVLSLYFFWLSIGVYFNVKWFIINSILWCGPQRTLSCWPYRFLFLFEYWDCSFYKIYFAFTLRTLHEIFPLFNKNISALFSILKDETDVGDKPWYYELTIKACEHSWNVSSVK